MAELRRAAESRDIARLTSIQTDEPKTAAELARAIYWTAGVAEAKGRLASACGDERLPVDSEERQRACAVLAFDELAGGRTMNRLAKPGRGAFLDKQKLFIAMVALNGNPAEPFIVDTGAPTTVISKRYADRVSLPYRTDVVDRSADAAGNSVILYPTVIESVKWGDIEVEVVPAHVLDLPENFRVGGILAPQDAFRGTAFEFDGPSKSLRMLPGLTAAAWMKGSSERTHETPLHWAGGNFFVDAQVAGMPSLTFLLDSGAGGNGVCEEALAKHGVLMDGGTKKRSAAAAGSHELRTGLKGTMSVGPTPALPSDLFVSPCPSDGETFIQKSGYVGAPWFWERRVFFPVDRRTIAFTETASAQ